MFDIGVRDEHVHLAVQSSTMDIQAISAAPRLTLRCIA